MNVLVERFQQQLQSLVVASSKNTAVKSYVVAYSGGMDSRVLLHLCYQMQLSFRAIHINHGLQEEADDWSQHCAVVCKQLNIPFLDIYVDAKAPQGESPENAARKVRYEALASELKENECLLTAHHKNDQSETLLLQLFRGAGPAGLASMPSVRQAGDGLHARPLLEFSRKELLQYANENNLSWVEDPSNQNMNFDRNLVRQKILPLIKERWQQIDNSLLQVTSQQQGTLEIIEAMAVVDLASVIANQREVISIGELNRLSTARQLNALRFWIKQSANDAPTANILQEIIESVVSAVDDAAPVISWGQSEVRRFQNELHLLAKKEHDETKVLSWDPHEPLLLNGLGVELSIAMNKKNGLASELLDKQLKVCFRQGGEKIQPTGRNHTHSLKKLMQEAGIPPWERSRIPLLYLEDELVCVCGYWMSSKFSVEGSGWLPVCK